MFYKDFPLKERMFWKNLYSLYQNKVWSIFDADGDSEVLKELLPSHGVLVDMTPEFRRVLRQLINDSSNTELDIKPSDPKSVMKVYDKQLKKNYVFTINIATGIKVLFRPVDAKFLEEIFNKISKNSSINEGLFKGNKKVKLISKNINKVGSVDKLVEIIDIKKLTRVLKIKKLNENAIDTTGSGKSEILYQLMETFTFFIKNAIKRYINKHNSASYDDLEENIELVVNNFLSSITKSQNLNAFDIEIENNQNRINVTIKFFENEMNFSFEIG